MKHILTSDELDTLVEKEYGYKSEDWDDDYSTGLFIAGLALGAIVSIAVFSIFNI